jgi:hypothetical protein
MLLFWDLKGLLNSIVCTLFISSFLGQKETGTIDDFRDLKVVYTDIGFSTAPFQISYPYSNGFSKIQYKNNFRTLIGIGFAYKWLSFRIGLPLQVYFKPNSLYGKTKQSNLNADYSFKKYYVDLEFRSLVGYSIQEAYKWDSTLSVENPNKILPNARAFNIGLNGYYFHNKQFKMPALIGRRAHYNGKIQSFYLRSSLNFFGIDNDNISFIPVPIQAEDNSLTSFSRLQSYEIGLMPGYVYVNRIKNWQFSGMLGVGAVIQAKYYSNTLFSKGSLSFDTRFNLHFAGGYSSKSFFVFLMTDFDNKSLDFNNFKYSHNFYGIKICGGYRFKNNKKISKLKNQG